MIKANQSLILIGKIVNTFGKNGFVKVLIDENIQLVNDSLSNKFFFYKDSNDIFQPLKVIEIVQTQQNLLQVLFENVNSISTAEKLKNKRIYYFNDSQYFIEKPNYLDYEIIYEVDGVQFQKKIISLMENSQYQLFKVSINDKEIWIPNVEEYVDQINDEDKKVFAKNVERFL